MIKLIAIDMDGTLLTDEKTVQARDLEAVARARGAGALVVPASGRSLAVLPDELLTLGVEYAITANGAVIVDCASGAEIYRDDMDTDAAARLADALMSFDGYTYAQVGGTHWYSLYNGERYYRKYMGPRDIFTDNLANRIRSEGARPEKIGILTFKPETCEEILKLQNDFPELNLARTAPNSVEMNANTVTKGAALRWLCGRLHIDRGGVMAIGDSDNDITMLDFAAFPFAMANATEALKARAEYFTGDNNHCGVAKAIETALAWL